MSGLTVFHEMRQNHCLVSLFSNVVKRKVHRRNQKHNRNGEDSIRESERLTDRKKDTAEAEEEICKVLRVECGAVWSGDVDSEEEGGDILYLESFEMWVWRRLEGIKWSDKVRNEEVLRRVGEKREILRTIKNRKRNWLGHILIRDCLQRRIKKGKLEGRISRGRKRFEMLTDMLNGRTFEQMKEDAQDRVKWRTVC